MRWEDERYVRVYTRDTVDWLGLSFIAQGLFALILRKVDRAGLIKLGKQGKRGVAIVIGFAGEWPRLEPALEELISDGCVSIQGEHLVVPNFIEAQEAVMSDKQRKAESRAKARDLAAASEVLNTDKKSESVTDCHETGQKVTSGHAASHAVTPSCAVPCRAVPSEEEEALSRENPREAGAADKAALDARTATPNHDALVAALRSAGVDATPAAKLARAKEIDAAVREVGLSASVARVTSCWVATR